MGNYFLTVTVKCRCRRWNSFKQIYLFYWIKFVKYIKLFKIEGNDCFDIDVTVKSSPKDGLLEFIKFECQNVSSFSWI